MYSHNDLEFDVESNSFFGANDLLIFEEGKLQIQSQIKNLILI